MADTHNPRGGAAEARNPEHYCTAHRTDGEPCRNYRLRGLTVCRSHGGGTPASVAKVAGVELSEIAARAGIPEIRPKDFPKVAAELIGWHVSLFGMLAGDLEKARILHSPDSIEHTREYGDILDRLDKSGASITRLMQAAAQMRLSFDTKPEVPPLDLLAEALDGLNERMAAHALLDGRCHACQQPLPVRAEAVTGAPEAAQPTTGPEPHAEPLEPQASV